MLQKIAKLGKGESSSRRAVCLYTVFRKGLSAVVTLTQRQTGGTGCVGTWREAPQAEERSQAMNGPWMGVC